MKKILYFLAIFLATASLVTAAPYDWHFNVRDSSDSSDINHDLDVNDNNRDRVIIVEGSTLLPKVYDLGEELWFDSVNNQLRINTIPISKITDLQSELDNKGSVANVNAAFALAGGLEGQINERLYISSFAENNTENNARFSAIETNVTDVTNDLDALEIVVDAIPEQQQVDWSQTSSEAFDFIKNKPEVWHNGVKLGTGKTVSFVGTLTNGTVAFHITDNGASNGNALCTFPPKHINVVVNDPSNTFGVGYALSNSDKTLTVTVNVRNFSATTILGISVLGSSSLSAAANGTQVSALITCT